MSLKKHGVKIFFGISCFLLALSLVFSAYSYARYVSSADFGASDVGTMSIDCEFTVNHGGGSSSFINAPFVQRVTENTPTVQMNSWAESYITLKNKGATDGLAYEYGFVLYLPQEFAERAMFQFVELKSASDSRDEEDAATRLAAAKKASEIYKLNLTDTDATNPDLRKLEVVTQTDGNVAVENDYRELIGANGENELGIDSDNYCAVLQKKIYTSTVKSTFSTYYTDAYGVDRFIAPVAVSTVKEMRFYRITVNLSYTPDPTEYVLGGGENKTFLFRLVLLEARDSEVFTGETFDYSALWETDESGAYTVPKDGAGGLPITEDKFEIRWKQAADLSYVFDNGNPVMEISEKNGNDWKTVVPRVCVGLTTPAKISVVFTQIA